VVKTAAYRAPFRTGVAVKLRIVDVAPEMALKETPPSRLAYHWMVGAGVPVAAAMKVAVCPEFSPRLVGFTVIAGAVLMVRDPAAEVVVPREFVAMARYWLPLSKLVVVNE
jgi:hypothetical protein